MIAIVIVCIPPPKQVVDVKADRVETVAIGGDPLLGGVDFDQALAHYLADM